MRLAATALLVLFLAGCVGTVEGEVAGRDAATGADAAALPDAALLPDAAVSPPDAATPGPDAAFQGTLAPGETTLSLTAAGQPRSAVLYAPAAVTSRALPLVLALHGNGDSAGNFVAALGLRALADSNGFVLAAPQGITQSFTAYGQQVAGVDWDAYRPVSDGNIDVPLLDALLSQLQATGSVDPRRCQVFGYSQGGYLAFRYGMEASARLACSALAAAGNPMPGSALVGGAAREVAVAIQIGALDGALANARNTRDELLSHGHPVSYQEVAGAGHVPFPGDPGVPLGFCLAQSLP